ncbi:MAG: extracellular solute-binding protein [Chloroflexota bacterium]|nr:extracellular solute-binding protein [Chloroflexota bacterium]
MTPVSLRKLFFVVVIVGLFAALGAAQVLAQDTFMGKTAEELFPIPGIAANEQEQRLAFEALMAAGLPDGTAFGAGQTITFGVLGQGSRGGISGTIYFWRNAFEAATGATLEIIEIPYNELGTTIPADFLTEQNTYDAFIGAAWQYGDWVSNGWIQPLDPFMGDARFPEWDIANVAPAFAALQQWDGQTYGTTNDGDAQLFYYRKDILDDPDWQAAYEAEVGSPMPNPPTTWQELLAVTTFFNGKDWNEDGDPDDGISLHLAAGGQGHFHYATLAASFAVTPSDGDDARAVSKFDNVFWFDPETMDPLINQPGHVRALEFLQELAATGPEAQFGWQLGEAWDNFLGGNAIATFSWGDVGSLSQDTSRSTIKGVLGASAILCSSEWYDREVGEFVMDTENPNCVGNTTGGSWHPTMSAFTDTPELTYYFMAMLANPAINFYNATTGWQGIDPSSLYHLYAPRGTADPADYAAVGFDAGDMERYIAAYGDNVFDKPTYLTYLRIPGTLEYIQETLDVRLSEAMTGQSTAQEALDATANDWNDVTDGLDRDSQLEIYQNAIGFVP